MLVPFGICFKQHFDTRYLAFCNISLKFDKHMSELNNSLTKAINAFKIIKNHIPQNQKKSTVLCLCILTNTIWYRNLQQHKHLTHTQNTVSAPSHPIQYPTADERTPMTPLGLVMAGCWQIKSILTNIGRRNSMRILNQYSFFGNVLI